MKQINKNMMLKALSLFDQKLRFPVKMMMGGGGAMVLAHGFPIATYDIDAVPLQTPFEDLDGIVKEVGNELNISPDWLNPYFSTFTHNLPKDYASRLIRVFAGKQLTVDALGREDMLIMKLFAGRQKDVPHAKLLLKSGINRELVERHLESLRARRIPGVDQAFDFLDDISEDGQ